MICIYFTAAIKQGIDFIAEYKSPDEFHLFKFYAGSFFLHYVTHVLWFNRTSESFWLSKNEWFPFLLSSSESTTRKERRHILRSDDGNTLPTRRVPVIFYYLKGKVFTTCSVSPNFYINI